MSDSATRGRHRRPGPARLNTVLVCALLAACSASLAAVVWTRSKSATSDVVYRQAGRLSYSAVTAPTSVYGRAGLTTGEPVYLKVVNVLRFAYTYRITGVPPGRLHGTEQLVAQVGNGQGIVRDLPLQPVAHFDGGGFSTAATLSLAALQAIAGSFASVDSGSSSSYTVLIVPNVTIGGRVGPARFKTDFVSPTKFTFSSSMLAPGAQSATPAAGNLAAPSLRSGEPIATSSTGHFRRPSTRPALLVPGITVADARVASLIALVAALCVGISVGLPLLKSTSAQDRVTLAARRGSTFADIDAPPASPMLTVVELSTLHGLIRVGHQLECPMLRFHSESGDQYVVVDNGTMYHFGPGGRTAPDPGRVSCNGSAHGPSSADARFSP